MARDEFTTTLQRLRPKSSKRSVSKIALLVLLLLGVALVVVDLAGLGSKKVLVASRQILPGDVIDQSNTGEVAIDLQSQSQLYLNDLGSNRVARDSIAEGELIPVSQVTAKASTRLTTLALELKRPMSSSIGVGDEVDVYSTRMLPSGTVTEPELTVVGAWIRKVTQSTSLGQTTQVVELSFAPEYLAGLLTSISREDDITLVNTPLAK
jgi:hypothetical protein